MPCPYRSAPRFGFVTIYPFTLPSTPSTDDVLILESPALKILGLDIYSGLTEGA